MLNKLNSQQREAVEHLNGPALVLAGAGAGKTRVLTQRVARLISQHQVSPSRILVVTFTNKAASEMKERLSGMMGELQVKQLWVGTFHAVCARLLREEIWRLESHNRRFTIYDPGDQEKAIKAVLEGMDIDAKQYKPSTLLHQISQIKSQGLSPSQYRKAAFDFDEKLWAKVYDAYQEFLALNNALDFDDLLFFTLRLLREHPEVLQRYQRHFQHILVDEYQDTNPVQFELVRLLAELHQNLFVVGDVDQSIYSFRHADFQIILRFQQDFPQARVIKLEHNYRSTQPILEAANALIDHNRERFDKTLISVRGGGEGLRYYAARDEYAEADYVLNQILRLSQQDFSYGDFCILYRTNAQSRLFEERLVRSGIPHQLIGAFRFYERKEIKDLLAYLAVIFNPLDSLGFKRLLNTPKRGIGSKTLQHIERLAEHEGLSLWDTLLRAELLKELSPKHIKTISALQKWLTELSLVSMPVSILVEKVYRESGYEAFLQEQDDSEERIAHVDSLIQAAREFELTSEEPQNLGLFLQQVALLSDVDSLRESGRFVTLMTIHGAKGLEFPVVFVTGLEERLFPHIRAVRAEDQGEDQPIEEERRLMYVAMTRAQDLLYLTHARRRTLHGITQTQLASRFLEEIETYLNGFTTSSSLFNEDSGLSAQPLWLMPSDSPMQEKPVALKADGLQPGDWVEHTDWGSGQIEKISSSGSRQIVIVAFGGKWGKRILDLKSAPLVKL